MKVKYVVLVIALVLFSIILSSCSLTTHEKGTEKEQVNVRDDFGCFTSCSIFSEQIGTEMCENWKTGKTVQWPPDCSLLSKYPNCVKLCESEKKSMVSIGFPGSEKSGAAEVAQKIAVHQMPQLLNIEFKSGVDKDDETEMSKGFKAMDFYLNDWFGHSITKESNIKIEVSADDSKFLLENGKPTFYYRTLSSDWVPIKEFKQMDLRARAAAHEYVHLYQMNQGCVLPGREGEKALWFLEGSGEWFSYTAMKESGNLPGYFSVIGVEKYLQMLIQQQGTKVMSLKNYEESGQGKGVTAGHDPGVYSYFAIAVGFLTKEKGMKPLDAFCTNLGKGQELSAAFQNAFGTSLEKFYQDFDSYYQKLQSSETSSGQGGPAQDQMTNPSEPVPGQGFPTQGQTQGQVSQEYCAPFASLPSCSSVGEPGSQGYNYCKQCYPDK